MSTNEHYVQADGGVRIASRWPVFVVGPIWLAAMVLLFLDAANWAFDEGLSPVTPGIVMEVTAAIGVICGAVAVTTSRADISKLPITFFAMLVIYCAMCAFSLSGSAPVQSLVVSRFAFCGCAVGFIGMLAAIGDEKFVFYSLRVVVLAAVALNIVDKFIPDLLPWRLSLTEGRAAGFFQNPNSSAAAIAAALPLATYSAGSRLKIAFYLATLAGVVVTESRGGLFVWIIAFASTRPELLPLPRNLARLTLGLLLTSSAALLLYVLWDPIQYGLGLALNLDSRAAGRLFSVDDSDSVSRLYAADLAWRQFLSSPWFGNGVGFYLNWEYDEGPHNTLLLTAAEFGVAGIAWLIGLSVAVLRLPGRRGGVALAAFIATALFSHNMFDDGIWAFLFACYWFYGLGKAREDTQSALHLASGRPVVRREVGRV